MSKTTCTWYLSTAPEKYFWLKRSNRDWNRFERLGISEAKMSFAICSIASSPYLATKDGQFSASTSVTRNGLAPPLSWSSTTIFAVALNSSSSPPDATSCRSDRLVGDRSNRQRFSNSGGPLNVFDVRLFLSSPLNSVMYFSFLAPAERLH